MKSMSINIPDKAWENIKKKADEKSFDIKTIIELVVTSWIEKGEVYVGEGPRIVIEWPRFFVIQKL